MSHGLLLKYFVLSPGSKDGAHGEASRHALLAYADVMEGINLNLAHDLRYWVTRCVDERNIRPMSLPSRKRNNPKGASDGLRP